MFTEGPTYAEAQPRLAALGIVAFHDWSAPERRPEVLQRVRFFVEASPLLRPLADAPTSGHRLVVFQPPAR